MTHDEQLALCSHFHLGNPLSCHSLGGTRNHNYLLQTTTGDFVARDRYIGYRDATRLLFDHAVLRFLKRRDVPVAPPISESWQQGSHLWELFPLIAGHHFRDADPHDIAALARALASFHREGRTFDASKASRKLGLRGETDPVELFAIIEKLEPEASPALNLYTDWTRAAASDLPDTVFKDLPHTLIHGDIQPANILIENDHVTALLDLDWCDWRPRIYDLAFTVLLCCSTHASPIDGGDIWSLTQPPLVLPELAHFFLETYDIQGWPLSDEERRALRPQTILSWCHVRLAGALKVEPHHRQEFLSRPPYDLAPLFPSALI